MVHISVLEIYVPFGLTKTDAWRFAVHNPADPGGPQLKQPYQL